MTRCLTYDPGCPVATLQARGVVLTPVGHTLRVSPKRLLTADEVEALRHHKAEVLTLLAPTLPSATDPRRHPAVLTALWLFDGTLVGVYPRAPGWPETIGGHQRTVGAFTSCTRCRVGTWVVYDTHPLCLRCARAAVVRGTLEEPL
jgi:hypothetical protein